MPARRIKLSRTAAEGKRLGACVATDEGYGRTTGAGTEGRAYNVRAVIRYDCAAMRLRLLERVAEHAAARPRGVAVRQVDGTPTPHAILTYGELVVATRAVTSYLRTRLPAHGAVLLARPNTGDFHITFLALLSLGRTVFPVPPDLAPTELLTAARKSGATAVIGTESSIEVLGRAVTVGIPVTDLAQITHPTSVAIAKPQADGGAPGFDEDRLSQIANRSALLLQSSGTTGHPRIARRPGPTLDAVASNMATAIELTSDDKVLAALPLCHSYGLEHGLLAPLWAGSAVHLMNRFDLNLVTTELANAPITVLPGVPFVYEALARLAHDRKKFPNLRRAYSAGSPLPGVVFDAFHRTRGERVSQLYGATEVGSVTFNSPEFSPFDPHSVGLPMEEVSVVIIDPLRLDVGQPLGVNVEGHVAIKAPSMFDGYVSDDPAEPPPPLMDGYFLTGDLGKLDRRGCLHITGRLKLLIDVGGLKVNPIEVEEVLMRHPDVGGAAVVGVKLSHTVSRLKAIVSPVPGRAMPSGEELRRYAKAHLSPHKVPRVFEVREELPRSATGKVLRHLLG